MNRILNNIFAFIFAASLPAQVEFNHLHDVAPERQIMTFNHNAGLRAQYRIKSIKVTKTISNTASIDSVIIKDPKKYFVPGHTSSIELWEYNRAGLPTSYSVQPALMQVSAEDAYYMEHITTTGDSLHGTYAVDYYNRGTLYQREEYSNALLTRITFFKKQYTYTWQDKNNTRHDTTYFCDEYIQSGYNNSGQLISRKYNNTGFYDMKDPCGCIETETYAYEKNKIVAVKIPYRMTKEDNFKYINEIELSKGKATRSTFFTNTKENAGPVYMISYDSRNNVEALYEADDISGAHKFKVIAYAHAYGANGLLEKTTDVSPGGDNPEHEQRTYYYGKPGLLSRIEYRAGTSVDSIAYEYTFYQ